MEILPLFTEAISLLPPERRWDVEFSTYFTQLPQGSLCQWRAVLAGTPEAKDVRRLPGTLVLDLRRPLGEAKGGDLVHLARTGKLPERIPGSPSPENSNLEPPAAKPSNRQLTGFPGLPELPPRGLRNSPIEAPTHIERPSSGASATSKVRATIPTASPGAGSPPGSSHRFWLRWRGVVVGDVD